MGKDIMELYQHANVISGEGLSAEVLVVPEGWAVVVPDVVLGNSLILIVDRRKWFIIIIHIYIHFPVSCMEHL